MTTPRHSTTTHPASLNPTTSPTDRWLSALPVLAPLTGPAGTAERLLLCLHYGIDWPNSWVGRYRTTYWSQILPDRVLKSTYRANTLASWWTQVSTDLTSAPRNPAERAETAALLQADSRPVLHILRDQTPALLLRVRLVADAVRDQRTTPLPTTSEPTATVPTTMQPIPAAELPATQVDVDLVSAGRP